MFPSIYLKEAIIDSCLYRVALNRKRPPKRFCCYSVGKLYPTLRLTQWVNLCVHRLQHTRFLCPPLYLGIGSNSCPLSWRCYLVILSSASPFPFRLQSFPASGSFTLSRLFASGGQSITASPSTSVLPMTIQGWFPLGLTGLITLQSKECSESLSNFSYGCVFSINFYLEGCVIFFFSGTCNLLSLWCCPQVLWNDSMPHSLFLFSALFSPLRLL